MIINDDILERTCKDMIETVLLCLSDATKGTIYRIGPMPELRAVVSHPAFVMKLRGNLMGPSGISDYNYPGKCWEE